MIAVMGRGDQSEQTFAPQPDANKINQWIESSYGDDLFIPSVSQAEQTLQSFYGDPPAGFSYTEHLPAHISWMSYDKQLLTLVDNFSKDLLTGYGMRMLVTQSATTEAERELSAACQQMIKSIAQQSDQSEHQVAEEVLDEMQQRERVFHHCCSQLGWPSDWVSKTIQQLDEQKGLAAASLNEQQYFLPQADDIDYYNDYGEPDPDLDPIIDLEVSTDSSTDEKLAALEVRYMDLARSLVAMEELIDGEQTALSEEINLSLQVEADRNDEPNIDLALQRWNRLRRIDEQQFSWACHHLGLSQTAVMQHLKQLAQQFNEG